MIDKGKARARYIRITITDTQKNGHMPAIWNVKVWQKAPELPYPDVEPGNNYPGMHLKDVAVPVRLSVRTIGEAPIVCARTRPKLIGGERARYE